MNSIDRKQKKKKVADSVRELDWQHQLYASAGWGGGAGGGKMGYLNPGIWSIQVFESSEWLNIRAVSDDFCFSLSFHFFTFVFLSWAC